MQKENGHQYLAVVDDRQLFSIELFFK
jgi:hypothetical protein